MMKKLFTIVALVGLLSAGAANSGTKTSPSGTITLAPGSNPYFGGTVSFDTTTSGVKANENPEISVACYQSGVLVYLSAGAPDQLFTLGGFGSLWATNGGAASCTAQLFFYVWRGHVETGKVVLASLDFDAGA